MSFDNFVSWLYSNDWYACRHVVILPNRRQALVEFESLEEARHCVTSTSSDPVYVGGQPAYCNYSTSQKIARPSGSDDANVNNILLFTILNPLYPITTVSVPRCVTRSPALLAARTI